MKRNHGIKLNRTAEGREFVDQMKPKKFRSMEKWLAEYNQVGQESLQAVVDLLTISHGVVEICLAGCKAIMEMPDCPPEMRFKAYQLALRAGSEANKHAATLLAFHKEAGVETEMPKPTNLPPDFSEPEVQ